MNATKATKLAGRQALQAERAVIALQYTSALKERLRLVFESHGTVQYSSGLPQLRANPGLALMLRSCYCAGASNCNGGREGASDLAPPSQKLRFGTVLGPSGLISGAAVRPGDSICEADCLP